MKKELGWKKGKGKEARWPPNPGPFPTVPSVSDSILGPVYDPQM